MNLINNTNKPKIRTRPTFDFVSPRSLVECVRLLKQQDERIGFDMLEPTQAYYELNIEIEQLNENTYCFDLAWHDRKLRTPFTYGAISGYLSSRDDEQTTISGTYHISLIAILLPLLLLPVIVWFMGVQVTPLGISNPVPLIAWCIIFFSYLWTLWRLQNRLVMILNSISEPPRHRV